MKKIRILCFCLFLCLTALLVSGCVPEWVLREHPISFQGATWRSEDGKVQFTVALRPGDYHHGFIEKDGILIEMLFKSSTAWNGMSGLPFEDYVAAEPDERGDKFINQQMAVSGIWESYDYDEYHGSDHYFTAEVYDSCIYEKGEILTFYRVDKTKEIRVEEFELEEYEKKIKEHSCDVSFDASEDLENAFSQGTRALNEEFGESSGRIEVFYDCLSFCWLIKRNSSSKLFGSTAYIIFQTDGTVLAMWED